MPFAQHQIDERILAEETLVTDGGSIRVYAFTDLVGEKRRPAPAGKQENFKCPVGNVGLIKPLGVESRTRFKPTLFTGNCRALTSLFP